MYEGRDKLSTQVAKLEEAYENEKILNKEREEHLIAAGVAIGLTFGVNITDCQEIDECQYDYVVCYHQNFAEIPTDVQTVQVPMLKLGFSVNGVSHTIHLAQCPVCKKVYWA